MLEFKIFTANVKFRSLSCILPSIFWGTVSKMFQKSLGTLKTSILLVNIVISLISVFQIKTVILQLKTFNCGTSLYWWYQQCELSSFGRRYFLVCFELREILIITESLILKRSLKSSKLLHSIMRSPLNIDRTSLSGKKNVSTLIQQRTVIKPCSGALVTPFTEFMNANCPHMATMPWYFVKQAFFNSWFNYGFTWPASVQLKLARVCIVYGDSQNEMALFQFTLSTVPGWNRDLCYVSNWGHKKWKWCVID